MYVRDHVSTDADTHLSFIQVVLVQAEVGIDSMLMVHLSTVQRIQRISSACNDAEWCLWSLSYHDITTRGHQPSVDCVGAHSSTILSHDWLLWAPEHNALVFSFECHATSGAINLLHSQPLDQLHQPITTRSHAHAHTCTHTRAQAHTHTPTPDVVAYSGICCNMYKGTVPPSDRLRCPLMF